MLGPITTWLRRLYDWVLGWADSPYSSWALFAIAFAESSFFPIPPDILLIALAVSIPSRAFRFALITAVGSVIGGVFGYVIGHEFFALVGEPIIRFYSAQDQYDRIADLYDRYDAFAVAVAGLTPIPYKVATITAGFFDVSFGRFVLASALSRSLRFFLIGGLIRAFGPQVRAFIERYFEILSIIALVMLVGGFVVLGWITGR
jgi:membrane protein YqaA with SNARE-associated domain